MLRSVDLFVAQRHDGVDADRPPRGHAARRQRDGRQQQERADDRRRIEWRHADELRLRSRFDANDAASPATTPSNTGVMPMRNTSVRMSRAAAPIAMRTPI